MSPNPNDGNFLLDLGQDFQAVENVKIYSVHGKVVHSFRPNSDINELHLEHLADGVYFVKAGNLAITKFLKTSR